MRHYPCLFPDLQLWSGILPTNRPIDWTYAGVPATLPDEETTSNLWTQPTRT